MAVKFLGVSSAGSRGVVRAEHVSRDEAGLRELLRTGYLRAAINLTGVLLSAAGQGTFNCFYTFTHLLFLLWDLFGII